MSTKCSQCRLASIKLPTFYNSIYNYLKIKATKYSDRVCVPKKTNRQMQREIHKQFKA